MKRRQARLDLITTILIISALSILGCKSKKEKIRWKFADGNRMTYNYTRTATLNIVGQLEGSSLGPMNKQFNDNVSGIFDFKTKSDKIAVLTMTVETDRTGNNLVNSEFFSGITDAIPQTINRLKVDYNTGGEIVLDETRKTSDYMAMQSTLDELFQMPPEPIVNPGDTWEKDISYGPFYDENMEGNIKTTFVGWEDQEGIKMAVFESEIQLHSTKTSGGITLDINITGNGNWTFCPSLGSLMNSEVNYIFEMSGEGGLDTDDLTINQNLYIKIKGAGTGKAELRPRI